MPSANELDGNHFTDYVIMNTEDKWTALPWAVFISCYWSFSVNVPMHHVLTEASGITMLPELDSRDLSPVNGGNGVLSYCSALGFGVLQV